MGAGDINIFLKNPCDPCNDIRRLYKLIEEIRALIGTLPAGGGGGCAITSVNGKGCPSTIINLTTTDIPEGINLYYTNGRVQAFGDPRYAFKTHTHLLQNITDFPTQAGHAGQILYTNGIAPFWAPAVPGFTILDAQNAVGNILQDSASIDFSYVTGTSITAEVKPTFVWSITRAKEISFKVGATNAPSEGDTAFLLRDCLGNPIIGARVVFFRERAKQYPVDDFTYNPATGMVIVTVPLLAGQRLVFEAHQADMWEICEYENPTNLLLINTFDALLINAVDAFNLD